MKLVYVPTLVALLTSGCAGLTNSYFDPIEYGRYVDIATSSRLILQQCSGTPPTAALVSQSIFAANYSASKIQNRPVSAAGRELQALIKELDDRYAIKPPSRTYCEIKLEQIAIAAETIAVSIGKKED